VQPHREAEDRPALPARLNEAYWRDRPVLVTGGASFIESHLTDALVRRGRRWWQTTRLRSDYHVIGLDPKR